MDGRAMSDEGETYSDEYVEAKRREYLDSLDEIDEDCLPAHKRSAERMYEMADDLRKERRENGQ